MMFTLALVLFVGWLIALGVFHVATGFVHVLLLMAAISYVWHLRDKSRRLA